MEEKERNTDRELGLGGRTLPFTSEMNGWMKKEEENGTCCMRRKEQGGPHHRRHLNKGEEGGAACSGNQLDL
jgi:hypothetical protein